MREEGGDVGRGMKNAGIKCVGVGGDVGRGAGGAEC